MLVNPWTPALPQPQLLVEIVGSGWAEGRAGLAEAVLEVGVQLLVIHRTSPQPFTPHPTGHKHGYCGQGTWGAGVMGQLGGGPCPSLPPAVPNPELRTRRGSPGSAGIGAPLERHRSKAAGCLPLSPVHRPSSCGHSLDAGGPEGLAWTERSTQYLRPRKAPGLGAAAPPFLYFTHSLRSAIPWESPSPFRPSRAGGRQGREGDQLGTG